VGVAAADNNKCLGEGEDSNYANDPEHRPASNLKEAEAALH
jgi:hypothetical protein